MRNRWMPTAFATLLATSLAGCGPSEDPDCVAVAAQLADAATRAGLKQVIERQFEAGELGPYQSIGEFAEYPGKYSVAVAPEFNALVAKPLQERVIVDARLNIAAILVAWAPDRGIVINVQPGHAMEAAVAYGDGVSLLCPARD